MNNYTKLLLIAVFACFFAFAPTSAEAAVPVPPGFQTMAPLNQPDTPPLRENRFSATLYDAKAPAGVTTVSYVYQGLLMDMPMADAAYVESIEKKVRNEEKTLSEEKYYAGKQPFGGGTLLLVQVPARANEIGGTGKEEYFNAVFFAKLGRGMLEIRLQGVLGGEGRVKDLIEFMRKGTNVAY